MSDKSTDTYPPTEGEVQYENYLRRCGGEQNTSPRNAFLEGFFRAMMWSWSTDRRDDD